ncbi:MAG TPA: PIN domain-containing protein [Thiotrichaceae bacterium]|nr:PIN domain-containing protein [Thiotrichaceae bacterium]
MFLWDTNILRYFQSGHPILQQYLQRVSIDEIVLPAIVAAEALRGRSEFVLKATPDQLPQATEQLIETIELISNFQVISFDESASNVLTQLLKKVKKQKKRHADLLIAAMTLAGKHILVTRNQRDFADLLPKSQLVNWIDEPPK